MWTYFWSPVIKDIVYGKILSKDNHSPSSPMMIIEHWVPTTINTSNNQDNERTPKSRDNILQQCEGCNLHYPYYLADLRPKCIILQALDKSLDLKIKPKSTFPNNRDALRTRKSQQGSLCQTTKSHHTLRTLAYNDYLRIHQLLNSDIISTINTDTMDSRIEACQYPLSFLHFYFLLSYETKQYLYRFYNVLLNFPFDQVIDIYTDGSCHFDQHQNVTMGLGWHVTRPVTPTPISFSGACKHFPSSTKAEAYAICTALLICPPHTTINICTDSQCCINTFRNITQRLVTPSRQLKIPNHHIWFVIMKIIKDNGLTVNLHKVKAHSENEHNDKADTLAKTGHTSSHLIVLDKHHVLMNIHIVWDQHYDNITIDHNIRHIARDIGNRQKFYTWLDYKTNADLKTASFNQIIDWPCTEKFFNFNPDDRPTSHKLTKFRAWQRKAINNLVPTMDIMSLRYPKLFRDVLNCWTCKLHPETNTSLWLCPINLEVLRPHIVKYTQDLQQYIRQTCDHGDFLLTQEINNNAIFKFFLAPTGSTAPPDVTSPFLLTCRQIITHDFIIWKPRNDSFKKWKTVHQVKKHTYRQYRQRHKRTSSPEDAQLYRANADHESQRRHIRADNFNTRHFYQTASFRSLQDHSVAFIYAMSSNFRHHGPWSSHVIDTTSSYNIDFFLFSFCNSSSSVAYSFFWCV
ncbi:ribonuclease H-like domain-containing protein [Rhizophagus clarus]|uniref:Ribonuclease H-like domain-containing protein n=1 Tax=Rhizophagus clarus TaxID=94130 RepID=A0A8H3MFH2_9GLOM|nr:ribonuclease H-like domain-containing protein [Rhizophagus clarus]